MLRKRGQSARARKETDRLLSLLEILCYNPEISDVVKEELIQLQFRRLEMFRRTARGEEETESLRKKILRELECYRGPKREDFRRYLAELLKPETK